MPDDFDNEFPSFDDDQTEEPTTPEPKPITKSILLTIKKMLGIAEEYHAFDLDIIININGAFLTLNQLGVGPRIPYQIIGEAETWDDLLGEQSPYLASVQTYTYLRVRLLFDPPTNSFLVDSFQKQIQELEWRFSVQPKSEGELKRQETFASKYEGFVGEETGGDSDDEPTENPDDNQNESDRHDPIPEGPPEDEEYLSTLSTTKLKKASVYGPKTLMDIFS